jgi:hypothetical protein
MRLQYISAKYIFMWNFVWRLVISMPTNSAWNIKLYILTNTNLTMVRDSAIIKAGFKGGGGSYRGHCSRTSKNRNRIHRFYWDICFSKITNSYSVFLFIIRSNRRNSNQNLFLLIGASHFDCPWGPHNCRSGPDHYISSVVPFSFAIQADVLEGK